MTTPTPAGPRRTRLEKQMGNLQEQTLEIIKAARAALEAVWPMTERP